MATNVFVLGLDEENLEVLLDLPHDRDYRFFSLLDLDEIGQDREMDMPGLLALAAERLDFFEGQVDAIIGFWDFPVSSLVPMLCQERGLPSAPLDAVVRCEHKYWSRLEQRAVIPEAVPPFIEADLDVTHTPEGLSYPLWVKPVKSFSSELAFRVVDDPGFREAMEEIRQGAGRLGESFQWVMDQVRLPAEVADAGGTAALVEEEATGDQITVEGYVRDGVPHVHGVIDAHTYPDTSSFKCYEYPSKVSEEVSDRLVDLSKRVISRVGLDNVTFNIEYFYDPSDGAIRLLEINPRHSQSHARLFELVHGVSNHEICLRVALGEEPELDRGGGYAVAAKWFLRRFHDGFVSAVPTGEEVARAEEKVPGTKVEILAQRGQRLSDLPIQDSYSFDLAHVFVGAGDSAECERKYRACVDELPFTISDIEEEV